ncbi:MAG: hypothetical protein EBW55_11835, partial [Betaproteobacteria bacterium]|nr:hypothetical protein [Betaproteobacteria bacterium]
MLSPGRVPSPSDWLLIDVGNTFLKWGRYAALASTKADADASLQSMQRTAIAHCIVQGRVLLAEIPILSIDWREQACPSMIVISSVAGTRVRNP